MVLAQFNCFRAHGNSLGEYTMFDPEYLLISDDLFLKRKSGFFLNTYSDGIPTPEITKDIYDLVEAIFK